MIEARKAGATIVTVDPYRSPTARRSDWHIQPRPGTDAALALGLMHVIWRDGLQDDEYLNKATVGAGLFRAARHGRVSSREGRGDHRGRRGDDHDLRPSPGPRAAVVHPAQLRHAAPPRRWHGRAHDRLPAGVDRLVAPSRRRGVLSTSGTYDFAMDKLTRPDLVAAGHAHREHEPTRRSTGGRAAGPSGACRLCLQLQPGRGRPQPGQGFERPAPRGLIRCGPRAVRNRHGRLRGYRAARHVAARTRGYPRLVRPSRRDVQPAGDRATGSVPLEQRRLPGLRGGWDSSPSCFPTTKP